MFYRLQHLLQDVCVMVGALMYRVVTNRKKTKAGYTSEIN